MGDMGDQHATHMTDHVIASLLGKNPSLDQIVDEGPLVPCPNTDRIK